MEEVKKNRFIDLSDVSFSSGIFIFDKTDYNITERFNQEVSCICNQMEIVLELAIWHIGYSATVFV